MFFPCPELSIQILYIIIFTEWFDLLRFPDPLKIL